MAPATPLQKDTQVQPAAASSRRIGRSNSVGTGKTSDKETRNKPIMKGDQDGIKPTASTVDLDEYARNQHPGDASPIDLATYAANQDKTKLPTTAPALQKSQDASEPGAPKAGLTVPQTIRVVQVQEDDQSGNGKPLVSVKVRLDQTLAQLRKQLRGKIMSSHVFCYSNGAEVEQENVTLAAYLDFASTENAEQASEQELNQQKAGVGMVYVKRREDDAERDSVQPPELEPLDLGQRLEKPSQEADKFEARDRDFADHGAPDEGIGEGVKHAGQLTAEEWEEVLENCGALCGWYVDRQNNKIVQAPFPAFRLRRTKTDASNSKTKGSLEHARNASDASSPGSSNQIANSESSSKAVAVVGSDSTTGPLPETQELVSEGPPTDDVKIKPRFHVNDNSKIEIIVTSHEFETSMATNDFSAQSTEASVSGGFGGFGASVSAGYASSESSTSKQTSNKYQKTMVGKYLYPRATLYLEPSDLELSPELALALANLAKSPNVSAMRKLHQDFGQLFCRRVTVGGRLLTTKTMTEDKTVSEQSQKQEYKVSVAVAVTTPYVSASVKHEQSKSSEVSQNTATADKRENHAFEAVGGDTILASNPLAWAPTCGPHKNWRVIDRIGLTPMADAISEVPGYGSVKADFARAIPVLAKYIETSQTREVKVRLCVTRPTARMSLSYVQSEAAANHNDIPNISYYLGHAPDYSITPRWYQIKDPVKDFWGLTEATSSTSGGQTPLFGPQSYRAPAIYGYVGNRIGKTYYGSMDSQDSVNTVWSISTPFDTSLSNQCRVMLRTVPKAQTTTIDAAGPPPAVASALAVFRNQQGVFLPAMTDEEHGHIFRVVKRGTASFGETIKEGDEIRLCWMLKDQTTGFRDFTEDAFGRRRTTIPPDVSDAPFFFKLPWPRFESLSKPASGANPVPNTLIMSQMPSEEPMATDLCILPAIRQYRRQNATIPYGLEDVAFRVDTVSNDGRGDAKDYMLWGLKQSNDTDEDTGVAAPAKRPYTGDPRLALLAAMFFLDDPEKVPYILRNDTNYAQAEATAKAKASA